MFSMTNQVEESEKILSGPYKVQRSTFGLNPKDPKVVAVPAKIAGMNKQAIFAIISTFELFSPAVEEGADDPADDSASEAFNDSLLYVVVTPRGSLLFVAVFLTLFLLREL
jgi:hypothetical protein